MHPILRKFSIDTVRLRLVRDHSSHDTSDLYLVRVGLRCIRDHRTSSPDGKWEVHETTTGCHGLLLSTNFDTKLTVRESSKGPQKHLPVIFESDAAEPPTLTWTGTNALEIEIRQITEVYQSLRAYDGIRISYHVTPNVVESIVETESHIGKNHGEGQLQPADEKIAKELDEDYRRYLLRCRDWVRLYTE